MNLVDKLIKENKVVLFTDSTIDDSVVEAKMILRQFSINSLAIIYLDKFLSKNEMKTNLEEIVEPLIKVNNFNISKKLLKKHINLRTIISTVSKRKI
jgi:hypothetical protein